MAKSSFETLLSTGRPRSLGRTEEAVEVVLSHPDRCTELVDCLASSNETIRMRTADALEKVCRARPDLVSPFTEQLLSDISRIEQPSVQWHVAQMLGELPLNASDRRRAIAILKRYLRSSGDWIVINCSLESLAGFAADDAELRRELLPILDHFLADRRKSVVARAHRLLGELSDRT